MSGSPQDFVRDEGPGESGATEVDEEAVADVEVNVNSRFIDFSLVTPWEHLVADLERAVKAWIRPKESATILKKDVDVEYLGVKYRFMLVEKNATAGPRYSSSSSVYQMMEWFGLSRCFIFSPYQPTIPSQSVRRVLYSACVCAVEALHCSVPVFLASTTVDALHRAREVLGYALLTPQDSRGRGGEDVITVHYESALLEGVSAKHVLFYLDGLLALFGSKLAEFSSCGMPSIAGAGLANVKEKYFFKLSENDRFLTRSVAYNNDTKKLRLHPEIQSCIEDLAAAFPDRDDTSASLNKLVIEVDYGVRKFGLDHGPDHGVDDNEFFTTLHPSALPLHSWEVQAEFLPLRNSSDLEPQGLAYCLRQLLALYIAGKCCANEQSGGVGNMSGKSGDFPVVDRSRALSVATVLSIRSRDAVSAVCINSQTQFMDENGTPVGNGGSIPQDLLMRAFSRSMWVDVDTRHESLSCSPTSADHTSAPSANSKEPSSAHNKCFGLTTSPWNWMANLGGAPVGSWLNLVAVYTGSLPDFCSMCYFWAECCHQLRVHSETGVPVPRLHPPQPVSGPSVEDSAMVSILKDPEDVPSTFTTVELWEQSLWDDVLKNRADKRMPFSLPDTDRCLIFQKLQMLQLCILCSDEHVTVDRSHLSSSRRVSNPDVGSSLGDHHSIEEPRLQRRLPMTSDMNAHTQYLQDKLASGKSRTGNDNPLLRWQVALPSVVSDARAFKASNLSATFEDFVAWYTPCNLPDSTLQEIWTFCTPAHADDQNALFKAEKEAEKVLGYLESLTPCQLTSEMLCTAMISMHMVLFFDLLDSISSSHGSTMHTDMVDNLKEAIEVAVSLIREDCPNLHDTTDGSISQHALLAVDRVCNMIQRMEETKARADSCRLQFDESQSRLRTELSVNCRAAATCPAEAKHLFDLAKSASRGDNHSWHSVDGRELGAPDVKKFDMWLLDEITKSQLSELMHSASQSSLVTETLECAPGIKQRMHVIASGDDLRVSLVLRESSHS